ncbi:MAG: 16S rRNA pseudouridine(516) synthase [Hydrogenophaga sp.]|uniref:16S rRNA pseudouridine(516) synthase n=1 Tax=Hydrogenophaga sp. TaxID=1904254 RepID=UPI001E1A5466|nr:16S rRNA pseudouridine(516) synthase [Hydrogenophaga sp.]MBX3610908.1 16S rRNA pseudouridine(516) synthase [Hydrogenophaga sp.]
MRLEEVLYSQGFGTRRICRGLIQQGLVVVGDAIDPSLDPDEFVDPHSLRFRVDGQQWMWQERAYLMMNKPAGYECSQRASSHPSIYTLLPGPLRQRGGGAAAGVQAVGRLDQDTTGLLLLSDDGAFIHRLTSPKHHVPKVYEVVLRHPLTANTCARLEAGVVLDDDPRPVKAAKADATGDCSLRLVLTQGKYHQVKRMIAAVGNRVEQLHRSAIGAVVLPDDLSPGQWRWLSADEVQLLRQPPR